MSVDLDKMKYSGCLLVIALASCDSLPPSLSYIDRSTTGPSSDYRSSATTQPCSLNEAFYCDVCEKSCLQPNLCENNGHCTFKCFCKANFFRTNNGSCVKHEDCLKVTVTSITPTYDMTCGAHQVYKSCQPCEKTCIDPNPTCVGACLTGCFCEDKYYKAPDGQCVLLRDCPKAEITIGVANEPSIEECLSDEVFVWCGWCEATCSQPAPDCPPYVCTRGCLCRPPLVRHRSGHCVEQKDCLGLKCPNKNEEYVCRYGCEPHCKPRRCVRQRRCSLGCHCKLGLFRDPDGNCVTLDNCASNNTLV